MNNRIIINRINITDHRIEYDYIIEGEWQEAFNLENKFFIEYSINISSLPQSIAVVPLLANFLPMAWVYDAEIICPCCDKAFLESIPEFKKGYMDMFPSVKFGGKLTAHEITENHSLCNGKAGAFFSGGVDAFNTLICHEKEKPTLITIWGADIKLTDTAGWERVSSHIEAVARDFDVDFAKIKTNFRTVLNEAILDKKIKHSGDLWWHGFQHGLAIICHSAPIAYLQGINSIYIASSFHKDQKGSYTCASDPTIDNYIKFADANIIHDGYELTRQDKIKNITSFSKKTRKEIKLRVCWISQGGGNCCKCEKCFRTIMGIYAEGCNPRDFGFSYTEKEFSKNVRKLRYSGDSMISSLRYGPIQNKMKKNLRKKDLPKSIRWFYNTNIEKLGKKPFVLHFLTKVKHKLKGIVLNGKKPNNR